MERKRTCGVAIASALLVAACGGGGGGSGPTPDPITQLRITTANGTTVATETAGSVFATRDLGGLVSSTGLAGTNPGVTKVSRPAAEGVFRNKVLPQLVSIPFGPETSPCAVAGTVTLSGDIASITTLTAGDRINVDFDACDDGAGTQTTGSLEFSVDNFSGDLVLGVFAVTMTLTLTDFSVIEDNETSTADGSVSVTLDTTEDPISTVTISAPSFTVAQGLESASLTDFSTTLTVDNSAAPATFVMTSSGALDSTELGGQVQYSTPVAFEGFVGEYPFTGELLVNGSNNSSLRLIALDNTNVRIEIDEDGDGTPEDVRDTTWDALEVDP